jgi:hypothetical protein
LSTGFIKKVNDKERIREKRAKLYCGEPDRVDIINGPLNKRNTIQINILLN